MKKNKNMMGLTLIAIATLLVMVVGATFAYFSALPDSPAKSQVDVTSNKTTSANIQQGHNLELEIDPDMMVKAEEDKIAGEVHTDMTNEDSVPKITFTSLDEKESSYCYKVEYIEDDNGFTKPETSIKPELVLNIFKTTNAFTDSSSRINVVQELEITNMTEKRYLIKDGENDYHRITSSKGIPKTDAWEMQIMFWNRKDFSQMYNSDKTYRGHLAINSVPCPEVKP